MIRRLAIGGIAHLLARGILWSYWQLTTGTDNFSQRCAWFRRKDDGESVSRSKLGSRTYKLLPVTRTLNPSTRRTRRPAETPLPCRGCFLATQIPYSRVTGTMEVKYKVGNERLVKVTGSAAAKLSQLLKRQGRPRGALRVAVIGGGCSGLQYKMDLVDGPVNRDILVESNNVRVVVDPKSALFVSGSLLDYSEDLQKGGFKVTNPNAVAHCSCGESFSA